VPGCISKFYPRASFAAALLLTLATPLSAQPANLAIVGLQVSEQSTAPGEAVDVTYHLRSSGHLAMAFNMGIFVRKGPHGTWTRRWGLPTPALDKLEGGGRIAQTWRVAIPDWGDGNYLISVHADPDNHLAEADEEDNQREISIFASSEGVGMTSLPLASPRPASTHVRCGDDTLRIDIDNTSLWPGATAEISLLSIRDVSVASNVPVQVSADGGMFEDVGDAVFSGATDADGRASLTWKPPDIQTLSGKGNVTYYLWFQAFNLNDRDCAREMPIEIWW